MAFMFVSQLMHVRSGFSVAAARTKSKLADESLLEPVLLSILIFIVVWPPLAVQRSILFICELFIMLTVRNYVMSEIWFNETDGPLWGFFQSR